MENTRAEKIIQNAPARMRKMLEHIYDFNANFAETSELKKLLEKVLFVMSVVDRKFFVPASEEELAYVDNALPIGRGQTISQPSTVARMLLLAELKESDSVLETGTGSGWNACLVAFLVYPGDVASTERILELTEKAEKNIAEFREDIKEKNPELFHKFSKIKLVTQNIFDMPETFKEKFDKIIFTAGITSQETEDRLEKIAENNLKNKGILICPCVSGPIRIYTKQKEKLKKSLTKELFSFVPLLGGLEK